MNNILEEKLFKAVKNNDLAQVKLLLKTDVDVNTDDKYNTPLREACDVGHLAIVKELLKHPDTDVNKADIYKQTPLWRACYENHLAIVKELLKHPDTDVNKTDRDNETPLWRACYWGYLEIVKELLKHPDIDVNKTDRDNKTPLSVAKNYRYEEIASELENHMKTNKIKEMKLKMMHKMYNKEIK